MRAYIGLTDPDWYSYLLRYPRVDEVNFWQPHGERTFRALNPGDIFFFKLRAPAKAIVGFGFFQRFESLQAWLAWDTFGEMNGASDFESMLARIRRLRGETQKQNETGDFKIGCIMISAPIFFTQTEWVAPPIDWAATGIQQGKSYDLNRGEGQRVLRECLERVRQSDRYWNVEFPGQSVAEEAARYGDPVLIRPRLGQGLFSFAVRDAYDGACAVTHEHSTPVLEAAHIRPYARGGEHRVSNGILLRRDLHRLYDLGYVTITPDYNFRVGDSLGKEFKNGRSYYGLNRTHITLPDEESLLPDRTLLDWHAHEIFKG